ncbi:MAG TPA: FAD binding domain-containing protein [Gaiellaceae bacterium]|nr:FAD binding domain-containing protein [Gaiellaceae bacterium]
MRLPAFTYLRPRELGEACAMLAEHGAEAAVVAGGTDLFPKLKRRQVASSVLVGLQGIGELRGIHANGGLSIGAGTRISEVVSHPALGGPYAALARAAAMIASPQIRNAGTVGGNLCLDVRCDYYDRPAGWREALGYCLKAGADVCRLASGGYRCWAISTSDLAPVALALEGTVRLVSAAGERRLPACDLYRNDGTAHLTVAPGEVLAELNVPPADGLRATYLKLRRRGSIDFPLVGVAAAVRLDEGGICTDARIALGAVASMPLRVEAAERLLVGRALDRDAITEAAEAAAAVAKPMNNTDLTPGYRKRMVRVYVARALSELAACGAEG